MRTRAVLWHKYQARLRPPALTEYRQIYIHRQRYIDVSQLHGLSTFLRTGATILLAAWLPSAGEGLADTWTRRQAARSLDPGRTGRLREAAEEGAAARAPGAAGAAGTLTRAYLSTSCTLQKRSVRRLRSQRGALSSTISAARYAAARCPPASGAGTRGPGPGPGPAPGPSAGPRLPCSAAVASAASPMAAGTRGCRSGVRAGTAPRPQRRAALFWTLSVTHHAVVISATAHLWWKLCQMAVNVIV